MSVLNPAAVERARREAAAQGLPPTIQDPDVLQRLALLVASTGSDGGCELDGCDDDAEIAFGDGRRCQRHATRRRRAA